MALNPFHFHSKSASGPAFGSLAVTPNDGAALWTQGWALAAISVASCLIVGYAGYRKRQT